ncbi:TonB-dependent receptor [Pseudoxanthomonas winnipegensis]|uniref:TonB-dependent receptor n=1 Tax=Pseudoxanthomonas winnipegensis TaxID=2480810 RepID=A0A4Q8L9F2_9GAMM|nr:TonB-dependent receptor [Pseudoxanthomonas winnipegensis]RZZ82811.1 TonB-dependent receptor [Pseudoxanthomonas winnipegensis]TAA25028.1 TonB-dependent receptor [Pseudoxanthomonas winnipegensis]TAA39565.1 TonB-dependent receptor [Pseudoxanthomonas winnipegensis]TBV75314.1 TonB-dependent receptor [Pseudoxanthomonas winnipegensis]
MHRSALSVALAMAFSSGALAQSTTGSIYGSVPAESGLTVQVQGDTGITRTATVDSSGRYNIGSLPVGTYTITLRRGDEVVDQRKNVLIKVNSGTDISFAGASSSAGATDLGTVTVTASSMPKVDVTTVDSRTVITSADLDRLPLGRSAEAIALLSPGAVGGSGYFTNGGRPSNAVSFGGSGVSENAYYINGFNTTNPYSAIGGASLPYGSIDQQETFLGGYGARYGRSDGGVINQIGKRGTNDWHFGGQVTWAPRSLNASRKSTYYPNFELPTQAGTGTPYGWQNPAKPGTIYRSRKGDTQWQSTYSAYVGGPLIEDRLFIFLSGEQDKTQGISTNSIESSTKARNHYKYSNPKVYTKLDWNINDSNTLEYTHIATNDRQGGNYYGFDYATMSGSGPTGQFADTYKINDRYNIFKYTGYLTDDLTLSATYGNSKRSNQKYNAGNRADLAYITRPDLQNPAITGGKSIVNQNVSDAIIDGTDKTRGLRVDLEYRLGDHTLAAGIDNMHYEAINEGQGMGGIGYRWAYGKSSNPLKPINPALGVGAPGGQGYYVSKYILITATNMTVDQKAYFLEDRWQVTDNVLLTLGVRNDKFTNYNNVGQAYVDSGDQWAPRLGASWDVFGDSSLKIYGNLGRYYLALPNSVAVRGASASLYTNEYFTYTGIDANAAPTGLTALGPGPVSSNGEYGQAPDATAFAASDLRSQYQDEIIFGFDKTIGDKWFYGAKATYRKLQTAIDDICDPDRMTTKLASEGIDPTSVSIPGCVMFNPGKTNSFSLANANGSGRTEFSMSSQDWGFNKKAKRDYMAVNLFVDHPFDGKWQGRVDYTWSKSQGNTEGQLKSDIGQTDVSKTQDWDAAALMAYAGGYMANDRRHQLKFFGAYQLAEEWTMSATMRIQSGTPKSCLGYFSANGTDEGSVAGDPVGYGASYHTCAGEPSAPGKAGRTPWTKTIDLGFTYRPNFAESKLAFSAQIFNILNSQEPLQTYAKFGVNGSPYTVSNTYNMPLFYQNPRYVQFSASYDF